MHWFEIIYQTIVALQIYWQTLVDHYDPFL